MTMKKALIVLASVLTFGLAGCASIVSSNKETITLRTNPPDAAFTITNKAGEEIERGRTPATLTLNTSRGYFQGETYRVKFLKDGYKEQDMFVDSSPRGWYVLGNLIFGGLIGWIIVDPLTGAMFTLSPEEVRADLAPVNGPSPAEVNNVNPAAK